MIDVRERIVEELIYERVHLDADLQELLELERDLGDSLRRAIAEAAPADEAVALADRCIGRVFRRLQDEATEQFDLTDADPTSDDCPLCDTPRVCSPSVARAAIARGHPTERSTK